MKPKLTFAERQTADLSRTWDANTGKPVSAALQALIDKAWDMARGENRWLNDSPQVEELEAIFRPFERCEHNADTLRANLQAWIAAQAAPKREAFHSHVAEIAFAVGADAMRRAGAKGLE